MPTSYEAIPVGRRYNPMLSTVYILTTTTTTLAPPNTSIYAHHPTLKATIYSLILLINEVEIIFVIYSRSIGFPILNKRFFPIFSKEKNII